MTLPPWYTPDADGQDLRPDPDAIRTVPEFLEALRQYRIWAGNPSFRTLSTRCRHRVSTTAFHKAMHADELPSLEVVHDFIGACGAIEEYRQRFEEAWRRLNIEGLIEASSFGTEGAKKLRARARDRRR